MITSIHNPLIKHLVKLRENKHYREKEGLLLISGFKLIREIGAVCPPRKIFVEKLSDALFDTEIYQVTQSVLKKITGLSTPEPIAAEFALPNSSEISDKLPLLALDAIQDPGNLGTLSRTALGFGWGGIYFLPGCVDPFNEKVIRSSRAALFQLPWKTGTWEQLVAIKEKQKAKVYIADMHGKPLNEIAPEKKSILLLSNEAKGLHKRAENFGDKIAVPMNPKMESLNVAIAGAILMYYLYH